MALREKRLDNPDLSDAEILILIVFSGARKEMLRGGVVLPEYRSERSHFVLAKKLEKDYRGYEIADSSF